MSVFDSLRTAGENRTSGEIGANTSTWARILGAVEVDRTFGPTADCHDPLLPSWL
ncbi:hypothetical protein SAMN04489717_3389 [Actinopolymorpha singaporensis]|uniref:Uncharacterized protein n=1 Tax=Actinopolymorpha singaporensis TaxID=117157 RepID=A0A1H1TY61_9ACTN|nr:hypothetical protein SAMN04489717_3389 [Actinopolymorpha singaporensis]